LNWNNFIQIAGVKSLQEAELLISIGVEFIGFPLRLPINKEDTTEIEAKEIIAQIRNKCHPILITYLGKANDLIEFADFLNVEIIQLHGKILLNEIQILREKKNLKLIKSLIVRGNNFTELVSEIEEYSPFVDAFITDTFNHETGASGATGKVHDWEISRKLVEISKKPIVLAGGLNHKNVKSAILTVKPAGVDSHTGVEDFEGNKSEFLVKEFLQQAKNGFKELNPF